MQRPMRKVLCNFQAIDQDTVTTPRNPPYQCLLTGYNKTNKTLGWWTRHMKSVYPHPAKSRKILDEGSANPIDATFESERSTSKEVSPAQVVVVPKDFKQEKEIAERCSVDRSAQRLIMTGILYRITVLECMAGHLQKTRQSVVERLEALKPENTPPLVPSTSAKVGV